MQLKLFMTGRVAIITARGGSKRIPRKNIRPFFGVPIIHYPIRAAIESGVFHQVMVSTDDPEIAEISRNAGASVPFMRSPENSEDHSTTLDVIREVMEKFRDAGARYTEYCAIYPTAVLLGPDVFLEASKKMAETGARAVIPVCRFSYPIQRALHLRDGRIEFGKRDHINVRSQDLEPMFHDAGQFYMGKVEDLWHISSLFDGKPLALEMQEWQVQDIDHESDWRLAELKFKMLNPGA
jgi:pseudaminic acid cytidylyltransferase